MLINGIFSFNVAFQCKRYSGVVGAPDIRDFRGSLTTNIEKGLFITTGTFSKAAREEACSPGKQQIDLLDGEEFINKLTEYEIGVHPITTYTIDEDFFRKIWCRADHFCGQLFSSIPSPQHSENIHPVHSQPPFSSFQLNSNFSAVDIFPQSKKPSTRAAVSFKNRPNTRRVD